MTEPGLFPEPPRLPSTPVADLSADRRRTLRQAVDLKSGLHPLVRGPLHAEAAPVDDRKAPGRRCGNCSHSFTSGWGYKKCGYRDGQYASHGAATDLRLWWPACRNHEHAGAAS